MGKSDTRAGSLRPAGVWGWPARVAVLLLLISLAGSCSSSKVQAPEGNAPEPEQAQPSGEAAAGGETGTPAGAGDSAKTPAAGETPSEGAGGEAAPGAAPQPGAGGAAAAQPTAKMKSGAMGQQPRGAAPGGPSMAGNEPGARVPYEEAFPEDFKARPPIRVGLLASPAHPEMGHRIAVILRQFHRRKLESALGRRVQISFVSRSTKKNGPRTKIHYRPDYLKAALRLAAVMPQGEIVEPMSPEELGRTVDIIVYLGDRMR